MKCQPNRNYRSDDVVMTPETLARALVEHFNPQGNILEPCCGTGNILKYLPQGTDWCEINKGKDFYTWTKQVDCVFTNPPWSQIKKFLEKSLQVAKKDIYFLCTINHLWTKARLKLIKQYGFHIVEICCFDTPKEFPQSGFQCGMFHLAKGTSETCKITFLNY